MENTKIDSQAGLNRISELLETFEEFLARFINISHAVRNGIADLERFRLAARKNHHALDWQEFIEHLNQSDQDIAQILDGTNVQNFSMGKLTLKVEDSQQYVMLSIMKERLLKLLSEKFDAPFKIKINQNA